MSKQKNSNLTYETAMTELQEIIDQVEVEQIGMDKLFEKVKRAIELLTFCQNKLRQVEAEIQQVAT